MTMKKTLFLIAAVGLLLVAFCADKAEAPDKDPEGSLTNQPVDGAESSLSEISWIKEDYASALAEANEDGKLLMIDVYTEWCGPCKMLDSDTFPKKEVVDKSANFVMLKLDAEKGQGPDVAKKFGVDAYPTILFVDGKGNLVHTTLGFVEAPVMVQEMDKALDKAS